jgi:hypothetical protein
MVQGRWVDVDLDELRRLVVDEGETIKAAAAILGITEDTAQRRVRAMGITTPRAPYRRDLIRDPDWLRAQSDAERSIQDVADEVGVSYGAVVDARRRFGIARPRGEWRRIDEDEVMRRLEAGESKASIARSLRTQLVGDHEGREAAPGA